MPLPPLDLPLEEALLRLSQDVAAAGGAGELDAEPVPAFGTQDRLTWGVEKSAEGQRARWPAPLPVEAIAVQADAASKQSMPLGRAWENLVDGAWRVHTNFSTPDRFFFVFQPRSKDRQGRHPTPYETGLLERALRGERSKVMAMNLGRSQSTVTNTLGSCLVTMGLHPHVSRVPVLLVAAALSAAGEQAPRTARVSTLECNLGPLVVVSVPRLDAALSGLVTRTEFLVERLLLDGRSYRQIAAVRSCSQRTVANQISSIFRKVQVSGRLELLLHVVRKFSEDDATAIPLTG